MGRFSNDDRLFRRGFIFTFFVDIFHFAGVAVGRWAALLLVEPDPEPGAAVAPAAHVAHRDAPARGTVGRVPVVEGRLPIL